MMMIVETLGIRIKNLRGIQNNAKEEQRRTKQRNVKRKCIKRSVEKLV